MGPPGEMKQSRTHYQFFLFFSPLPPPQETLPENEVYFVADNKNTKKLNKKQKQCLTLISVFRTGFLPC